MPTSISPDYISNNKKACAKYFKFGLTKIATCGSSFSNH